jgi:hypothetical protein
MMYIIEMYVEAGHWSIRIHADSKEGRPHNTYEWNPTGGSWAVLGGSYASYDEAEAKIVQFSRSASATKPRAFRTWKRF